MILSGGYMFWHIAGHFFILKKYKEMVSGEFGKIREIQHAWILFPLAATVVAVDKT